MQPNVQPNVQPPMYMYNVVKVSGMQPNVHCTVTVPPSDIVTLCNLMCNPMYMYNVVRVSGMQPNGVVSACTANTASACGKSLGQNEGHILHSSHLYMDTAYTVYPLHYAPQKHAMQVHKLNWIMHNSA